MDAEIEPVAIGEAQVNGGPIQLNRQPDRLGCPISPTLCFVISWGVFVLVVLISALILIIAQEDVKKNIGYMLLGTACLIILITALFFVNNWETIHRQIVVERAELRRRRVAPVVQPPPPEPLEDEPAPPEPLDD